MLFTASARTAGGASSRTRPSFTSRNPVRSLTRSTTGRRLRIHSAWSSAELGPWPIRKSACSLGVSVSASARSTSTSATSGESSIARARRIGTGTSAFSIPDM